MSEFKMPWLLTILILFCFRFRELSEARHEKSLPYVTVVGTVYCDTCFQDEFTKTSHFISGASVVVECEHTSSRPSFRKEVKTNDHGKFIVHLPFSVPKHVQKIKGCSVKLIGSNESNCAVASTKTRFASFHIKSRKQETYIFSAGSFTFKPLKQPKLCNSEPISQNPEEKYTLPIPLIQDQEVSKQQFGFPFPPNPFLPPPSIIPPVIPSPPPSIFPPIFPSPPPSIIPPILPSPPPPPFFSLPPIPGITPSPPPPTPPFSILPPIPGLGPILPSPPPPACFSFHLPPFPSPGVPPGFKSP